MTVFFAVHHGLGGSPGANAHKNINLMWKWLYINNFAYLLTINITMLSVSWLISRITRWRLHLIMTSCISVSVMIWALLCGLLLAFQCNPPL